MLEGHADITEAGRQLMPPKVICPHCQAEVFQAKFCLVCGSKLNI
jgi:predicted amidophosphoribosyltransferase